jgi:hypothetical protein
LDGNDVREEGFSVSRAENLVIAECRVIHKMTF